MGDSILLGLWTSLATHSDLYRYVWTWRDGTVWYETNIVGGELHPKAVYFAHYAVTEPRSHYVEITAHTPNRLALSVPHKIENTHILCEFSDIVKNRSNTKLLHTLKTTDFVLKRLDVNIFVQCPN